MEENKYEQAEGTETDILSPPDWLIIIFWIFDVAFEYILIYFLWHDGVNSLKIWFPFIFGNTTILIIYSLIIYNWILKDEWKKIKN